MPYTIMLLTMVAGLATPARHTAAQSTDATTSTRDSVYTEPQARRGEALFRETCVLCHLPDYFTTSMMMSWSGAPISMLFEVISTTMPQDRPGVLSPKQYADVLAYIFELNGFPAGARELPAGPDALARIIIERSN